MRGYYPEVNVNRSNCGTTEASLPDGRRLPRASNAGAGPRRRNRGFALVVLAIGLVSACSADDAIATPDPAPRTTAPFAALKLDLPTVTPIVTSVPPASTPESTPTPRPTPPVVLRTAELGGWTSPLDPHNNTSSAFHRFFGNVYSGLLRWQTDGSLGSDMRIVVPDLAVGWSQPDARTYEFRLREGARWHDVAPASGRLVTADDVAFSIRRLFGSSHQSLWRHVASVSTLDASTVRITLIQPYAGFLGQLASGFNAIVLPELFDGGPGGKMRENPPVGTGPFAFDAADSHFLTQGVAVRHTGFYEPETPGVDRLERVIAGDQRSAIAMLRTGRIDFLSVGVDDVEEFLGSGRDDFDSFRATADTGWALTLRPDPPFDDPRARLVANLSIDRSRFWATFTRNAFPLEIGLGMPLPGPDARLPAEDLGPPFTYDPARAQTLWESLGPASTNPFVVSIPDVGASMVDAALELVRGLRRVGFSVEANVMPAALYAATAQAPPGLFQVALGPVGAPPEADLWLHERFGQGGAFNIIGGVDPELDRLIEEQRGALDAAERAAALRRVQSFILEAAYQPMIFLDQTWIVARRGWTGWPVSFPDEPFQRFLREVSPSP